MPTSGARLVGRFSLPDKEGHFGPYGGIFVPETLMAALEELESVYRSARDGSGVPGGAPAPPLRVRRAADAALLSPSA